jgi:hypothetical protein
MMFNSKHYNMRISLCQVLCKNFKVFMGTDRVRRGRNPGKIRVLVPSVAVFLVIGLVAQMVGTAVPSCDCSKF